MANAQKSLLTKYSVKSQVKGVWEINDCAKWYINLNQIKKTVIWKNHFVSLGVTGGLAASTLHDFELDGELTNDLNTRFFTQISVLSDTLLAEEFDIPYYFDVATHVWKPYKTWLPIKHFDILTEDTGKIWFSFCAQEQGSWIIGYDKRSGKMRSHYTSCPAQAVLVKGVLHVVIPGYHSATFVGAYRILDFWQLKLVPPILKFNEIATKKDALLATLLDKAPTFITNIKYIKKSPKVELTIQGLLAANDQLFALVNLNGVVQRMLGKIENDTVAILGYLGQLEIETTTQFGETLIVNNPYGKGFYAIRNDSIVKISYETSPLRYNERIPKIAPVFQNLTINNVQKLKQTTNGTQLNFNYENAAFTSNYGGKEDGAYITLGGKRRKLKFYGQDNPLYYAFNGNGNAFLYFMQASEMYHKYGLIEITNMNRFYEQFTIKP